MKESLTGNRSEKTRNGSVNAGWRVDHSTGAEGRFLSASRLLHPGELDLDTTLGCGQAFRWRQLATEDKGWTEWGGEGEKRLARQDPSPRIWQAVVRRQVISLWQDQTTLYTRTEPGYPDTGLLDHYFDLQLSLASIRTEIAVDSHVQDAMDQYPGLRILQQEPWETLISFILSQWSNVPRISKQVEALSRQFGEEIAPGWFAFPTPAALASADPETLRSMGLGYRVEYVLRAARKCADQGTGWLENLAHVPYRTARDTIVLPLSSSRGSEKVHGVGPKVADCVLLFSLGHYQAFPVDVHVRRAMEKWYGETAAFEPGYDSVADFGRRHFGRYAGYAQQYLFHRQRMAKG